MNSPSRYRGFFMVLSLVVAGQTLGFISSLTRPPNHPVLGRVTSGAGLVFAAGSRGSGVGTPQFNYQSKCATCHGTKGEGDGWTAWIFRLKVRDLTDAAYMRTLSDDYLFQIIKQGGASLGKPGMPSWGHELTDQEIRDLLVYIRSLAPTRARQQPSGGAR